MLAIPGFSGSAIKNFQYSIRDAYPSEARLGIYSRLVFQYSIRDAERTVFYLDPPYPDLSILY